MVDRLVSTLLPCPLCTGRPAGRHGACPACRAALPREARWERVDGVAVAWLGAYEGPLLRSVRAVKFGGRLALAHELGGRLGLAVARLSWPVGRVVPVPLHRARRLRRGYDQAARLARGVSATTGASFSTPLRRVRATPRQARADGSLRAANVRGAFRCRRLPPVPVLLVDDVWTTGSTARACRDALLDAGAREVRVAVVARAGASPHDRSSVRTAPASR